MTDTPLTDQQLNDIDARTQAATKGPWAYYDGDNYADVAADLTMTSRSSYSYREKIARLEDENYWDDPAHEDDDEQRAPEQMVANAAFIAHAREDVPALLAEVRRLRFRVAELGDQGPDDRETVAEAAQMYRSLRPAIERTMAEPDRWDGDEDESFHLARYVEWLAAGQPDDDEPDTLPAWLAQRFDPNGPAWDRLDEEDRAYWEHQARAVRRAVARNGFKPAAVSGPQVAASEETNR